MVAITKSADIEDAGPEDVFACNKCGISTTDPEEVGAGGWNGPHRTFNGPNDLFAPLLMVCGKYLLCSGCYWAHRDRLGLAESEETGWWEL